MWMVPHLYFGQSRFLPSTGHCQYFEFYPVSTWGITSTVRVCQFTLWKTTGLVPQLRFHTFQCGVLLCTELKEQFLQNSNNFSLKQQNKLTRWTQCEESAVLSLMSKRSMSIYCVVDMYCRYCSGYQLPHPHLPLYNPSPKPMPRGNNLKALSSFRFSLIRKQNKISKC